jgi:B12-binding domain/radical SAM domain protein
MRIAIAFKYCGRGCGTDFYYGYSVEQTIGAIEVDDNLSSLPILLFDNAAELYEKSLSFDRVLTVYLFRSVYAPEVWAESLELRNDARFVTIGAGTHPSGDPIGSLQYLDYVVVGDSEIAIRELLTCLIEDRTPQLSGVWYTQGEKIIEGGRAKPIDLDMIPPFAPKHKLFSPIEITRGCPWACRFCSVTYVYGGKLRHRSVEEIIRWVKVANEGGIKVINFLTPNAFCYGSESVRDPKKIRKEKIEELLSRLARIEDVKIIFGNYLSNVRPDFVSEDLIDLVKRYTQTPTIHMGGQSGSNRILQISRVGYTVEDIRQAVKVVRNSGLNASVDFIFGLPGETEKDRKETLRFIKELIALGARPRIHAFMPLPGTPFYNQAPGKVPTKYREALLKWAAHKQVMIPFEYEEVPWRSDI